MVESSALASCTGFLTLLGLQAVHLHQPGGITGDPGHCHPACRCPPCRQFTPLLARVYNKLKAEGKDFEYAAALMHAAHTCKLEVWGTEVAQSLGGGDLQDRVCVE